MSISGLIFAFSKLCCLFNDRDLTECPMWDAPRICFNPGVA